MSELLPPPPGRIVTSCGFGDPALVFPEFAAKQCMLEKVPEEEGEGEDESNHDKTSGSRISGPWSPRDSIDERDIAEIRKKAPDIEQSPSRSNPGIGGLRESSFTFSDEEEISHTRNSDSFADHIGEDKRRCSGFYRKCCACTCMLVSLALLILLLTFLSLNASIKSQLPQVYVVNLKFTRLGFAKSATELLLNANLNTVLQLSNENDKTVLYYSPMTADVSSENINFGQSKLLGFKQKPGEVTTLKIISRLRKSKVYDVDATLLRNKSKNLEVVVDVYLRGKIGLDFLGFRIHLPVVIACEGTKQSDVNKGLKPKCEVRIFSQ